MKITINLLPDKQKSVLRAKHIFHVVMEQQVLVIILLVLTLLGLLAVNYILKIERDTLLTANDELIKRAEYVEILDLHKTFAETNIQVKAISRLQKEHIGWDAILHLLSRSIPSGISVDKLSSEGAVITLQGVSQKVDSLVAFQSDLSEIKMGEASCFLDVAVPDQYLVKSEDVDFVMTFRLNVNDCMKEKYE